MELLLYNLLMMSKGYDYHLRVGIHNIQEFKAYKIYETLTFNQHMMSDQKVGFSK